MMQPDLVSIFIFLLGVWLILAASIGAGLVIGFGLGKGEGYRRGIRYEQQRQEDITRRVNAKVTALVAMADDEAVPRDRYSETEDGADDEGRYIWPSGLPGDLKTQ